MPGELCKFQSAEKKNQSIRTREMNSKSSRVPSATKKICIKHPYDCVRAKRKICAESSACNPIWIDAYSKEALKINNKNNRQQKKHLKVKQNAYNCKIWCQLRRWDESNSNDIDFLFPSSTTNNIDNRHDTTFKCCAHFNGCKWYP